MANVTFAEAVMVDSVRFFHATPPTPNASIQSERIHNVTGKKNKRPLPLCPGIRDTSEAS